MPFDSIKTIIIILTLLMLLYKLLSIKNRNEKDFQFMAASTIVTLLLLLIISLKLHHIFRSQFNIPNTVTYALSAAPFIYYFYRFRKTILSSRYFVLIISILLFGSALLLDLITDGRIITFYSSDLIEEILRLLGTSFWFLYYYFYVRSLTKKR
jgi:hypothetical protein